MMLDAEQRRALTLLAKAGTLGLTETMMQAHGFKLYMIADLARTGFANSAPELVQARTKTIAVIRFRITNAGRQALAEP